MKSLSAKASTLLLVLLASASAVADNNFGIGAKVGTLGAGLEGIWRPLPYFDLRAGGNLYDYDDGGSHAGINYDATLNLESYYATANLNFPLSPFRLTGGMYLNGNELNMKSANSTSFDIGGQTFTPTEVGQLSSTTSFTDTAPYVGVGYDFSILGKVGLNLDLGVLWQGEADVTLTADGSLANDQQFQAALEAERLELEGDVSDYKAWPVIALGFVYNF